MAGSFWAFLRAMIPASLLLTAGCSALPTEGPSAGDVAAQVRGSDPSMPRYLLVDINASTINKLRYRGPASFQGHFSDFRPSLEPRIGIGDTVSVTIWEASAGGLFSAPLTTDRFSPGSKSATIPDQVVGRDGGITVPYAGRIIVAGRTTRQVQAIVEQALQGKAIQPQVLINDIKPISNTVTVTGEVAQGARVPLSVKGDRIMDVIAEMGSLRAPVNETYVQLTRGATTVRVPLTRVASDPHEDIYLRPNDVLTLIRDPQKFIAYGAAGQQAEIPFDAEGLTLAQALAKAGGLLDYRSDAAGVFVLRYEPASVARRLQPGNPLTMSGWMVPVVYRLDLHDTASLFAMQSFHIQNHDLIYISNSLVADAQKVLGLLSTVVSPAASAGGVATTAAAIH